MARITRFTGELKNARGEKFAAKGEITETENDGRESASGTLEVVEGLLAGTDNMYLLDLDNGQSWRIRVTSVAHSDGGTLIANFKAKGRPFIEE